MRTLMFGPAAPLGEGTPITERVNFEVRADNSNLFNRTAFGNIFGDISVPANFGRATGPQLGPRIIQIAGRLNF